MSLIVRRNDSGRAFLDLAQGGEAVVSPYRALFRSPPSICPLDDIHFRRTSRMQRRRRGTFPYHVSERAVRFTHSRLLADPGRYTCSFYGLFSGHSYYIAGSFESQTFCQPSLARRALGRLTRTTRTSGTLRPLHHLERFSASSQHLA